MKEIVFHLKLLGKAYFMTGAAMVRPASSDFWKVPLDRCLSYRQSMKKDVVGLYSKCPLVRFWSYRTFR